MFANEAPPLSAQEPATDSGSPAPKKSILVYRYGLLAPTENAAEVHEQIRLAHRYRNDLIQIERGRRAYLRALLSSSGAAILDLENQVSQIDQEVERLAREVKAQRASTRSRSDTQAQREALRLARAQKSSLTKQLGAARKALHQDADLQKQKDALNEVSNDLAKNCRKYSRVYWGTYLLIEGALAASKKMPLYDGTRPNDPDFVRWPNGQGTVGVQLQGGLDSSLVFGQDTQLRIASVNEEAWYSDSRGERRRLSRTTLSVRVNSTEKGKPVWAAWPMIMHRPLPEGSVIKEAAVHHVKHGPRSEWYVTLTVDTTNVRRPEGPKTGKTVAIDIGWRETPEGKRFAAWKDSDGETGRIEVDPVLQSRLDYPDKLRSIRDQNFNAARALLIDHLKTLPCPEWFAQQTSHLAQWRSCDRLAKLVRFWGQNRFAGDENAHAKLEAWRYHDEHIASWEASQRTKALRRRKEFYRTTAAKLAKKYQTVIFEEFKIPEVAKIPEPESEELQIQAARTNRQRVAVAEFRLAAVHAANMSGRIVAYEPAPDTTRKCQHCGHINVWDQAAEIRHTCSNLECRKEWDQDDNAAANLLRSYSERLGAGGPSGGTRDSQNKPEKEGKRERVNRLKREKDQRREDRSQSSS